MCGKVAKTSKGPIPQPFLIRLGEVNGYLSNIVGNGRLFGFLIHRKQTTQSFKFIISVNFLVNLLA